MARFEYKVIADILPKQRNGNGLRKPLAVTVHHSAVFSQDDSKYDPVKRAVAYSNAHMSLNGGIAYDFFIGAEDSNIIYITGWFNSWTHHCSNGGLNPITLPIVVDGCFEDAHGKKAEQPTEKQLKKLRQLFDDINSGWFKKNWGNADLDDLIGKLNINFTVSGKGKTVYGLHDHSEAAEAVAPSACCGKNLRSYVIDYRIKSGNVGWGEYGVSEAKPVVESKPVFAGGIKYQPIDKKKVVVTKNSVDLWDFSAKSWMDFKSVGKFANGQIIEVVGVALHPLNAKYYMTQFSWNNSGHSSVPFKTFGINAVDVQDYIEETKTTEVVQEVQEVQEVQKVEEVEENSLNMYQVDVISKENEKTVVYVGSDLKQAEKVFEQNVENGVNKDNTIALSDDEGYIKVCIRENGNKDSYSLDDVIVKEEEKMPEQKEETQVVNQPVLSENYWRKYTERKFLISVVLFVLGILKAKFGWTFSEGAADEIVSVILFLAPLIWSVIEGFLDKEKIKNR